MNSNSRIPIVFLTSAVAFSWLLLASPVAAAQTPELTWPAETNVTKPWCFWHWMGNAVNKADIGANLAMLQKGGIGGVLNVQLLDLNDPRSPKVPFLSAQWVDIMKYTIDSARSLGMDMDMSGSTGWGWGGPWITAADADAKKNIAYFTCAPGGKLSSPVFSNRGDLQAVMGYSADGLKQDLLSNVDNSCNLNWTAPTNHGTWTIYAAGLSRGSSSVSCATPDGGGRMVDYLSPNAMQHHLDKFATAFAGFNQGDWPRAWFDDSWEGSLDWSDSGFVEFQKRRGYDLRNFLPELLGNGTADNNVRVKRDYMLTIGDMMIDGFFNTTAQWAKSHNSKLACETINHPGNTVDMAAATDIPNADVGGGADWWLPGGLFSTGGDYFGRIKVQTSGAHIMGKPLIGSETMTCWGPTTDCSVKFLVTLRDIKQKIDLDLIGGINHTMYHSISYSPAVAQWPGYMFAAGTQVGPYNPYWPHLAELNKYISLCQAFLQEGTPDIDVLFYYPCDDMYMHGNSDYLYLSPVAKQLVESGYDLDYVTDKMLLDPTVVSVTNNSIVSPGSTHKAIVIANCTYMEDTTLQRIFDLANAGASVAVVGSFPTDVPGMNNLASRRTKLNTLINSFNSSKVTTGTIDRMTIGSGQILRGSVLSDLMTAAGVKRETMVDYGLRFTRRKDAYGWVYFIANPPGNAEVNTWVSLGEIGNSAALFDPMTGNVGIAAYSSPKVCLQLKPAGSIVVRVFANAVTGTAWVYQSPGQATPITGTWQVQFLSGGPTVPTNESVSALLSWTTWTSSPQINALRNFSGIARYSISFNKPAATADVWFIDLGNVASSAKVTLNGTYLGMVCGAPDFRVNTKGLLLPTGNQLDVEVANLATNRVAYEDINGISWRFNPGPAWTVAPMFTTSFVPLASGLLGPVTLVPSIGTVPASSAQIIITGDNGYDLYLNGTLLGSGSNWNQAQRYSLPLVNGANVVAVKGRNDPGTSGGILAEIIDDSTVAVTDTSWRINTSGPANWTTVNYSDAAWTKATDLGQYGVTPWGSAISGMPSGSRAHWIWSGASSDSAVYFRLKITQVATNIKVPPSHPAVFQFTVRGMNLKLNIDIQEVSCIRIFDLKGRVARTIAVFPACRHVQWDRRAGGGEAVSKGIYLVQFRGRNAQRAVKINLL
jgi:hypothetical protein